MKGLLKYVVFVAAGAGTIVVIATTIMVWPGIGSYVRSTLYHLSRCRPKLRVGHTKVTAQSPSVSNQSTNNMEQICTFLVGNASYLINLSYACIVFYLAGLLPLIIKGKWELDTAYLLLAISVVYLLAFHLPRMGYPNIHLSYVGTPDTDFCDLHCRCLQVKPGDEYQIEISIANVGLLYYKNCSVWLHFPSDCTILEDKHALYNTLSYRKTLNVQRGNNICLVSPKDNDLSIAPFTAIRIPIWVNIPQVTDGNTTTSIHISVISESNWGMATGFLEFRIA